MNSQFGIYYVTGNHEAIAGYKICEDALQSAGVHILENQKVEVEGLQIGGLAYTHETDQSVRETLNTLNLDPSKPSILLKHIPSHVEEVAKAGVSLMLSGHTHQAQVWPFRYITQKVFKGFDYGLKTLNQLQVYTSSGVGTWGPPVRIFTKSEIVKITLE